MAEHDTAPQGTPTPNDAGAGKPGQQTSAPSVHILGQYIKDLSFENPGSRGAQQQQPNIDIGIDVGATPHESGNGVFEVSLRVQGKATDAQSALFVAELDYAGLFQIQGFKPEEMEAVLLIECPRLIFPFARRILADITLSGGFPPLLIDPIDFRALYLSQKQRQQEAQQTPNAGPMATVASPPQQPT